jgi:hypothetical protein
MSGGAANVSEKRKSAKPKQTASRDLRIKGVGFKDTLRALLQTPPQKFAKKSST